MLYRIMIFCLVLAASTATALAGDDAPAWLQQAAAQKTPAYDKNVTAVVLVDEANVTVSDDGRATTTSTYAVRILVREGRSEAHATAVYLTDTGKVREMKAWLIRPDGTVKRYGKDETADVAGAPNDIYDESRTKQIHAEDDAEVGSVFGYQVTSEDRSVFTQSMWYFQEDIPVLSSRYTVALPAGWRATGIVFNHPKIEPTVNGSSYTWELRNLPPIEDEPGSPSTSNLVPRLAVNYYPATGTTISGKTFENWSDVARWMSELEDPQATVDDALAAKAKQLTANAKTELELIQAIGHYVQNIQYISIQIGVGRGGGYRPHPATEVFAKSYGDCKDKANLMRAMLRVVGIDAYLVSIYSGDPAYVREEWPSPHQFNHCIIAVKVGPETKAQTVVEHPTLGRLLIFDATDENTPVGDLPDHEQGSLALIDAKQSSALLRMPVTSPEMNRLEQQTDVQLSSDGSITGTIHQRFAGQSAVHARRVFRGLSRPDFNKTIEMWVAQGASGAKLAKVEPTDQSAENSFSLDVDFAVSSYGQLMQDRLLVFKPAIVSRRETLYLTKSARTYPVVLNSHAYTETARIKLPEGFEVDELPDALKLDTAFGNYVSKYEVKDGQLIFTRTMTQRAATIPADQYTTVRNFYERIRAAEQAPVVLAKK